MYKLAKTFLTRYAQVLVHYGLNWGNGINKGDTVMVVGHEYSKDLFSEVCDEIWRFGGNVIPIYLPNEMDRWGVIHNQLELATDKQLSYFPNKYWQGAIDDSDHVLHILAEPNVHLLQNIPSGRIAMSSNSKSHLRDMIIQKEAKGKLTRTLCLYGTESMANEVGLSIEEYWDQIIKACYLNDEDPIARWRQTRKEIVEVKQKLDSMQIRKIYIEGNGTALDILIGQNRKWLGASGRNIPSFEVFISPDWRGTVGVISFDQPLYYNGKRISGVKLHFQDGIVRYATATENQDALLQMIAVDNANKLGEFSLTDKRHSRITKRMGTTLFDENMGGEFGNTHIALGNAYKDSYTGDIANTTKEQWEAMGFNQCPAVHTDIISTIDRKVTATLAGGEKVVIYDNGQFTLI